MPVASASRGQVERGGLPAQRGDGVWGGEGRGGEGRGGEGYSSAKPPSSLVPRYVEVEYSLQYSTWP